MNRSTLLRLSGLAAIAAGPLCVLGGMLHPIDHDHAHSAEALGTDHVLGSISFLVGTVTAGVVCVARLTVSPADATTWSGFAAVPE